MTIPTDIRVGCASWLDKSLINEGDFYPRPSMNSEDRLSWYSEFFNFVEVNATYYTLPNEKIVALWDKRTPQSFLFGIKAWGLMTGHNVKIDLLPHEFRKLLPNSISLNKRGEIEHQQFPSSALDLAYERFKDAIKPLADSGKLGYILFQFAPWIRYGKTALDYLSSIPERLPGYPIAIEFRHESWIPARTKEVLKFLSERRISCVAVDAPWMPRIMEPTSSIFVIRCHGMNIDGWQAQLRGEEPTVAEKYDYLYSEKEVRNLVDSIRTLQSVSRVFVVFNNNRRNYPIINGLQFRRILGENPPDPTQLKKNWRPKGKTQENQSYLF